MLRAETGLIDKTVACAFRIVVPLVVRACQSLLRKGNRTDEKNV